MSGPQECVQTQRGLPSSGLINPRLFLSPWRKECAILILLSPPGLTSLEKVLAPRGSTKKKKDWKPVDLSFSPAARQHVLQSFYKEAMFPWH